jgi:hypothetical protein
VALLRETDHLVHITQFATQDQGQGSCTAALQPQRLLVRQGLARQQAQGKLGAFAHQCNQGLAVGSCHG